jgi:hypothetical protein
VSGINEIEFFLYVYYVCAGELFQGKVDGEKLLKPLLKGYMISGDVKSTAYILEDLKKKATDRTKDWIGRFLCVFIVNKKIKEDLTEFLNLVKVLILFIFFTFKIKVEEKVEELDGPAVSALRRAITEAKQRWSAIGWVTKKLFSRAPPCFRRHVKPLVPAAFAVVSTHQSALGPRGGLWPVLPMCNT